MSGELDDTQLVSFRLPRGRGKRREGTEFEVFEVFEVFRVVESVKLGLSGLGSL